MRSHIYFTTTKGTQHAVNEDCVYIGKNIFILADGMGGANYGDIASQIAVDILSTLDKDYEDISREELKSIIISHIFDADVKIRKYAELHPEAQGMGTTVIIVISYRNSILIAWCGDSRCYKYKNGSLSILTKDHSYVQQLIDDKIITREESFSHPDNSMITRFIGGGISLCLPDMIIIERGDIEFLIACSDGLSGYCTDSSIKSVIESTPKISIIPEALKDLALNQGSDDDITIVTFKPVNYRKICFNVFCPIKNFLNNILVKLQNKLNNFLDSGKND